MRPDSSSLRLPVSYSLTISLTLSLICAIPQSMDFFAGDYLGTEPYLDDMYYEPEQPDLFFPDPMSDTSLIASGLSDSSSSEAAGSSNWDSLTEFYTSESFFPQDFCQAQSENPFGDDGFADDWMLRARDDGAATCEYPKSDQTPNLDPDIMLRLDQNIPKVFAPLDLKKPKKDVPPPPDPNRRIVKEYEECFLPYLTRCCCTGFSAWGDYTIWGDTLAQINECSVVFARGFCPSWSDDVCCKNYNEDMGSCHQCVFKRRRD